MNHRYRQDALPVPGAQAKDYSPAALELAPPTQGHLALDNGALGPLFDKQAPNTQEETNARID
jgi:hypothetical protein